MPNADTVCVCPSCISSMMRQQEETNGGAGGGRGGTFSNHDVEPPLFEVDVRLQLSSIAVLMQHIGAVMLT